MTGSPASGGRVDGAEAKRLVAEENAQLVDVRTPGEFAGGHPAPAVNIPLQEIEGRTGELSADRPVIVYCRSGARSASSAGILRQRGFTVYDMGSVDAWRD